jgi:hypothetical protein
MPVRIRLVAELGGAQVGRQDCGQRDRVRQPAGLGLVLFSGRGRPAASSILVLPAAGVSVTF